MGLNRYEFVVATRKIVRNIVAIVFVALWTPVSVAGIILEPTGGATVLSGPADEVQVRLLNNRSYVTPSSTGSFNGKFYNQPVTDLWISDNGNLNFDGTSGGFFPNPFTTSTRLIAPFWDDFIFLEGSQIINHSIPGSYLAITWKDAFLFNDTDLINNPPPGMDADSFRRTTQVVWFERDMNLRGFDFKKDDIAFGYSGFSLESIDATIGVSLSNSVFTGIPGGINGSISSPDPNNLIPWDENEFLLFRPTTDGSSYTASTGQLTAVPEPSSLFLALGWIALAFAKWRSQKPNVPMGKPAGFAKIPSA